MKKKKTIQEEGKACRVNSSKKNEKNTQYENQSQESENSEQRQMGNGLKAKSNNRKR